MTVLVWAVASIWIIPIALLTGVLCGCAVSRRCHSHCKAHLLGDGGS